MFSVATAYVQYVSPNTESNKSCRVARGEGNVQRPFALAMMILFLILDFVMDEIAICDIRPLQPAELQVYLALRQRLPA